MIFLVFFLFYKCFLIWYYLVVSFIISALYGFIMKGSGVFPHLQKYYYDKLGVVRSMYHDGISGLIVQFTLLFLVTMYKYGGGK